MNLRLAANDPSQLPLPEWLLRLLSVETETLQGATGHVRFARFPEGGWGFLAILLIVLGFGAIFWLYRREGKLSRARQHQVLERDHRRLASGGIVESAKSGVEDDVLDATAGDLETLRQLLECLIVRPS